MEPAESADCGVDEVFRVLAFRDVRLLEECLPPSGLDRANRVLTRLLAKVGDDDVRPGLRQGKSDAFPIPLAPPVTIPTLPSKVMGSPSFSHP